MPSWYVVLTAFRDAENLITLDLEPIGNHFRGDDAALRAEENEVIAGGVDSPFVFSVFMLESRFGSQVRVG